MSVQDKARQNITQHRHQVENRQQSILARSEAEIEADNSTEIQEEAREALAQQRQTEENRKLSMQYRSEAEST
jgi:hypothetical protein